MGLPGWAQTEESLPAVGDPEFDPLVRKIPWSRKRQPTQHPAWSNSRDRGAWWAVGSMPTRVGHDKATNTFTVHLHDCTR